MRELLRGLIDLILPPSCAACGVPTESGAAETLCRPCSASLPRIPFGACSLCQAAPARDECGRCLGCELARRPLAACVAAATFEGDVARWVHAFKYPARGLAGLAPGAGAALASLLADAAQRAPGPTPALVIPVPLHPGRLRARGFNPAGVLARGLARRTGIPWDPVALERVRDTPSQTGLDRRARRRNVRGAMRARRPIAGRIWLVDDVVTTGATLEEAARALRHAGARSVVALCPARTPAGARAP